MARGRGEQSDRMMRGAESGAAQKQRAHEGLMGQYQAGAQQTAQMASTMGQLAEAGERRQLDEKQGDAQLGLQGERLDLDAAQSGFKRNPRMSKLDAEMDRGAAQPGAGQPGAGDSGGVGALDPAAQERLRGQTSQPSEMDGERWIPTDAAQKQQAVKNRQEDFRAETDRIRAEAYADQTAAQMASAKAKGEGDLVKQFRTSLIQPIKSNVARFDRFQNGKNSDQDWSSLEKLAEGNPEPGLMKDIQAKQWTPRVQAFMSATIAYDSLKFIGRTGELPDGDMVDLSSPQMQQFSQAAGMVTGWMRAKGADFSNWASIESLAQKTAFVNKMAAGMVLSTMTEPGAYNPQGGIGEMTPSAGMPNEGQEQMTQPVQGQPGQQPRPQQPQQPPRDFSDVGTDNALNRGIY